MKIWHFSDSHTYHDLLTIPKDIDLVICSGDISNPRDVDQSEKECYTFLDWYEKLPIRNKIFCAGNHDIAIERKRVSKEYIQSRGIIYLENESVKIGSINIWGSPYTPSFGVGWAFNRKRDKLHDLWSSIPDNTHIVISHGPPKGILDHSYSPEGVYERCGCEALRKKMLALEPELCLFGHIHSCSPDITNAGTTKLSAYKTIFSNGSVVWDGKFGKLFSNGNILEI